MSADPAVRAGPDQAGRSRCKVSQKIVEAGTADIREISIDQIQADSTAQMRVAGIDPAVVADYADAMESGAVFPPIIVFHDGADYWPGDGFHRIEAARRIDREIITADIRGGGKRDALLLAASANATHGLRRTRADKRKSVETLLRDPEWSRWSDREIGKKCAVDHKTVGNVRRELTGKIPTDRTVSYRDRHGNESRMRVSGNSSSGSVLDKVLAKVSTEVLIAECRRRGLDVRDV